jgi:two-component system NarL family sensor kinase/methyl-accepting chemotaxis protein
MLGEEEVVQIRSTMMASKQESLRNYMEIAASSLRPILESETDPLVAQEKVETALRAMSYGDDDGYVFAFDYEGLTKVHSFKPQLEGKNLINLVDVNGVEIIKELIQASRNGGGYVSYLWDKPSKGREVPKLSYAVSLKEFDWMLGTGFYIDDIDDAVILKQQEVDDRIQTMMVWSLSVGFGILILIIFINLWFSNRALVQPIRELAESARQMSLGKMDTVISIDSKDEIGELADAIGRMQKSLKVIFKKLKQTPRG